MYKLLVFVYMSVYTCIQYRCVDMYIYIYTCMNMIVSCMFICAYIAFV